MTDKPIIFSAPMVRALLDGRKTQTRRVLKPQPPQGGSCYWAHLPGYECWMWQGDPEPMPGNSAYIGSERIRVPYAPGDRLYVREAWRCGKDYDAYAPNEIGAWPVHYESDGAPDPRDELGMNGRYRHARFMPRWASRLTLTVTDVRVQRLQDIGEADAVAEGSTLRANCSGFMSREQGWSMDWSQVGQLSAHATGATRTSKAPLTESDISLPDPQAAFASYFNSLHGPDAWVANQWVIALTFDVHRCNIDQTIG